MNCAADYADRFYTLRYVNDNASAVATFFFVDVQGEVPLVGFVL